MSGEPTDRRDEARFGAEYYRRTFGLDELRPLSIHWWSVSFYARLARRLLRRAGGRRFLDVGCAHGYTLARLEREFDCCGIDVSDYAVGRARANAPRSRVFVADVTAELPPEIEAGGFDVILAKYVLEHLPDPAATLRRLHGLLAPGGALLYSVPDLRSPSRARRGDAWYALLDETHVSLLEPDRWLELTREAGLVVERTFADGIWDLPWYPRIPRLLQYATLSLPTIATVALARPLIPAGWGENLLVIARRRAPEDPAR
ncbi:MAG: hypothetical protein Kow0062_02030 [Acidobacteriota bacterium]|nr:MAG: class I SAM-dependent methyltransferase [Acidobacteriota bacterium]